ncbi:MAG: Bifunctional ligase/repressor BirA [Chlamydiae bacterium]|nr:Bifunctional ligase/repressor BirA [Chlamydiota bacterium]
MKTSIYHHLESIDSTQAFARANRSSFDPKAFTVITSKEQTKGRGRLSRSWYSPKGTNLYTTYSFTLPKLEHSLNPLTLVLALSISEVLQKLGLTVQIKWPNDLYIHSKKISGILAEVEACAEGSQVYLGFGLNINMTANELQTQKFKATSLLMETGKKWSLQVLSSAIENAFKRDLSIFIEKGFSPFHKPFEELSFFQSKVVKLDLGNEVIAGNYKGVNEEGALILELPDSQVKAFLSGEVIGWE